MGAARAIVDAGAGHDRRCILQDGLTDVDGLSELLPPRRVAPDAVRIIRREPVGHLVVSTAEGPVELHWTEHTCTVRRARSGTVSGEVTTADGRPVEGADVRVCSQTTRTDRDGRYVIEATVDGSAPVSEDRAWCTLHASHPDHGSSITEQVDLLEDPVVLIALDVDAPDPADLQMQQQVLQEQAEAIVQGEFDPAFEAAAGEADILAELAERPDLDAATRRALYNAARQRIEAAGDNSELVEILQRGPEP